MNIHERIKELRLSCGLSQKELAEELNKIEIDKNDPKIFTQTISYWENGRDPNLNGIRKLARFFNCSVDFLLDESDIKNWSEFSVLSHFDNKSMEQFTTFLKEYFEEEIAMAIMDSFFQLMIGFTGLPTLAKDDMIAWESEITDTINGIAYLLEFSQSIRSFQSGFFYSLKRVEESELDFSNDIKIRQSFDKYMELQIKTINLIQRIFNDSLKYNGTVAVDLFLSEKELLKRKESQMEFLKNNEPELYKMLAKSDNPTNIFDENLFNATNRTENPDQWKAIIKARIEESNLKFRNK